MATKKITQLDLLASGSIVAANDVLPIVGISTDITYKTTVNDLKGGMGLTPITSNDSLVFIEKSTKISEPVNTTINLDLKHTGDYNRSVSFINYGFSGSNPDEGPAETILSKIGLGDYGPLFTNAGGIRFYTMPQGLDRLPETPDATQLFGGIYAALTDAQTSWGMKLGGSGAYAEGTLHVVGAADTSEELRPYVANFEASTRGVKFPTVSTTDRDLMSGQEPGTVIWNPTLTKLQVYTGIAWVDLH